MLGLSPGASDSKQLPANEYLGSQQRTVQVLESLTMAQLRGFLRLVWDTIGGSGLLALAGPSIDCREHFESEAAVQRPLRLSAFQMQ